jgi:hypothetical protein
VLEIGDRLPEALGRLYRLAGFSVRGNGDYAPGGDRSAGGFLKDGEFHVEAGVSYIACTSVDVQGVIEKSPPVIPAIRPDIKKSVPSFRKSLYRYPTALRYSINPMSKQVK